MASKTSFTAGRHRFCLLHHQSPFAGAEAIRYKFTPLSSQCRTSIHGRMIHLPKTSNSPNIPNKISISMGRAEGKPIFLPTHIRSNLAPNLFNRDKPINNKAAIVQPHHTDSTTSSNSMEGSSHNTDSRLTANTTRPMHRPSSRPLKEHPSLQNDRQETIYLRSHPLKLPQSPLPPIHHL